MNIFIGVLAVLGIIFVLSILNEYVNKKEKEWKKLEKEKKWESKIKTSKKVIEKLNRDNRDKMINNSEK